jgi:hypothetical protein
MYGRKYGGHEYQGGHCRKQQAPDDRAAQRRILLTAFPETE